MKYYFCLMTICFGLSTVNASAVTVEQQITADLLIRQVVTKNLLGSRQASATNMLKAMVNRQVKAPYTSITVGSIECDNVLGGKDQCQIDVIDATNDGTESMNRLNVTIEKGEVKRATFTLVAS